MKPNSQWQWDRTMLIWWLAESTLCENLITVEQRKAKRQRGRICTFMNLHGNKSTSSPTSELMQSGFKIRGAARWFATPRHSRRCDVKRPESEETPESGGFIAAARGFSNNKCVARQTYKSGLSSRWTRRGSNTLSRFTRPSLLQQDAEGIFWSSVQRNHSAGQKPSLPRLLLAGTRSGRKRPKRRARIFLLDYSAWSKRFNSALLHPGLYLLSVPLLQ